MSDGRPLIPLPGLLNNDDNSEVLAEAFYALLKQRGPTSEEAMACWVDRRRRLLIDTSLCELFETGRVDFRWKDEQHSDVLVHHIEKEP